MPKIEDINNEIKELQDLLQELEEIAASEVAKDLTQITKKVGDIYSTHKEFPPLDKPPSIPGTKQKKRVVGDNADLASQIMKLLELLNKTKKIIENNELPNKTEKIIENNEKEESRSKLKKSSGILKKMTNFLYSPMKKNILYIESLSSISTTDLDKISKGKIKRVVLMIDKNNVKEVDAYNYLINNGVKIYCPEKREELNKYLKLNKHSIKLYECESLDKGLVSRK